MHAWDQIQTTVEYIEDHMAEQIAIQDLADRAALSPFYFQRLFHRLVGTTVNDYIKKRRLAKATRLLQTGKSRILDVALDCGFASHEALTRAFKDAFGITPDAFRTNPVQLNHYNKPELLLNYTLIDEDVPLITKGIVLEITRKKLNEDEHYLGYGAAMDIADVPTGKEANVDNSLSKLWDTLHAAKSGMAELIPDGEELGMASMTPTGHMRYFAGAKVRSPKTIADCESRTLPKGEYIACLVEAEDFEHLVTDAIYKATQYLFETWLPKHGITVDYFSAERYANHSPETTSMEIWARVTDGSK